MAIATGDQQSTGIQRGRGGFMRGANDVPWIVAPNGDTVKSGPRKGEPKRVAYGSPSNRGKQIENTTNLVKWGERRVVLGIGSDPALVEACARLVGLDVDSDEYRTAADAIIIAAKDAAKANLAAERGTHGHALAEDFDNQHDWLRRAEDGEDLGIDTAAQAAIVAAWATMLADNGLEVLAAEASCVDDRWRLAGTLDRVVRCTKPLRFAKPGGELVDIAAGTVLILDVKTGKLRRDRTGAPMYWQAYSIQIASYAQSVPYDTETEQRGEWPWPIDQDHALIAHLDIEAALAGDARCELVYVDLIAGREHGGECVVQAKAWEARNDVFSVAQLAADEIATSEEPAASLVATDVSAAGEPDLPQAVPPPAALTPAEQQHTVRLRTVADDGDLVDNGDFDALQKAYDKLTDEHRIWIGALTEQAMQAGVSFHAKGNRTLRRYHLIRALVILCQRGDHDDETLRGLLWAVIGDCALFPAVTPGQALGSLDVHEAGRFAALIDGRLQIHVQPDGKPALRSAA